jgi:hypothetical protein
MLSIGVVFKPPGAAMEFDAFLSYNSADLIQVRDLRRRLMARGLRVWFDREDLRPGQPWQQGLEAGIRGSGAVLVCLGASGIGPWQNAEQQAALNLAVRNRQHVIPVLRPGAPADPPMPLFLGSLVWVDLRASLDAVGIDRLVWGITGTRPPDASGTVDNAQPAPPPPNPRPPPPPPHPGDQALRQAWARLSGQYAAAIEQSVTAVDAVTQVKARQQADDLARQMREIEGALERSA